MKAVDVYAGVGGWTWGLRLAGIDVVAAYEIWPPAIKTYNANLGTEHVPKDVRTLDLKTLPKGVSLVVGSPPCTEFSFANRGGGGDLSEGLKDIVRFLEIVEHLKPKHWIMENVPRTAGVIRAGLKTKGHPLHRFRALAPLIEVVDLSGLGLPQSRRRCFVGNIPFDRLKALGEVRPLKSLGAVVDALSAGDAVTDPVWGFTLTHAKLTEVEAEPPLNAEQLRMNREAKRFHPVYNDMPFPDALDQPSRTVTATCTRVSRESIVIDDGKGSVRRLSVRERATLQSFPITYQFYGSSHPEKIKMVGNALPPILSFMVGCVANDAHAIPAPDHRAFALPSVLPKITPPPLTGVSYPMKRRFRAALPGLRFKSGMRFELGNVYDGDDISWTVRFYFGPSDDIRSVLLDGKLSGRLQRDPLVAQAMRRCAAHLAPLSKAVGGLTPQDLQDSWRQASPGLGPYAIVDMLGRAGLALTNALSAVPKASIERAVVRACRTSGDEDVSERKLAKHAIPILAGLLLGSWFNGLGWRASMQRVPGARRSRL